MWCPPQQYSVKIKPFFLLRHVRQILLISTSLFTCPVSPGITDSISYISVLPQSGWALIADHVMRVWRLAHFKRHVTSLSFTRGLAFCVIGSRATLSMERHKPDTSSCVTSLPFTRRASWCTLERNYSQLTDWRFIPPIKLSPKPIGSSQCQWQRALCTVSSGVLLIWHLCCITNSLPVNFTILYIHYSPRAPFVTCSYSFPLCLHYTYGSNMIMSLLPATFIWSGDYIYPMKRLCFHLM